MECSICNRISHQETPGVCTRCTTKITKQLSELPKLQQQAGKHLVPARTGSGTTSAERSIGINVTALDFSMATDLIRILHSWESQIRQDRQLRPPAMVKKEPSTEEEVQATVTFHLAHLRWSMTQTWAVDFVNEVNVLHAKGLAATKQFSEQPRRIPCPSDDCKRFVVIDAQNLTTEVTCFGCRQTWTVLRLVALAMSNPKKKFFLDVEAISLWLSITEREVYRLIKKNQIDKQGNLYNLSQIMKARIT